METKTENKQYKDISRCYDLFKGDGIIEAFFQNPNGKMATRFYEDKDKFIEEALSFNNKGYTAYISIQPRKKELLKEGRSGTNNGVVAIRYLCLDIDPVKPQGLGKANATNQEKERCLKVARTIQSRLQTEKGYKKPILADSGNGAWLFMKIPDIPITDENRKEISARLKTWGKRLSKEFHEDGAKIDTNIFDLRRMTKIFGSKIFNAPDATDRPQRISSFISDHEPIADQKLLDDFSALPIEIERPPIRDDANSKKTHDPKRMIDRCYAIRFLKEAGDAGTNIPNNIRLALSGYSIALGDLENNLFLIKSIIGGCPNFSESVTRSHLEKNFGKCAPYGCEKLTSIIKEHFENFDLKKCNCKLPPSFDPATKQYRKPSPIRFAYVMEDDLEVLSTKVQITDNQFENLKRIRAFTQNHLVRFDPYNVEIFLSSKKKEWGLKNNDIKHLLKYRQEIINLDNRKDPEIILSEADKEKAIEVLERPSLLYDWGDFVRRLGVVGEEKNIRIILLALTSCKTESLVSLVLKGESSAGKSYITQKCLAAFPNERYFEFTAMTDRAMIYTDKDFRHKFIVFYEFSGQSDELNYLIRSLQSEGRLKYECTVKQDGAFTTQNIDKEGPTGFITTTTKSQIFDENETRIFSLYVNDTEDQTKGILKKLGDDFQRECIKVSDEEIETWKNTHRLLKPYPVQIPYAKWLSKNVPADVVRIRRDAERVLTMISVCTFLHQFQREKILENGIEYLQASVVDYLIVRELLEGTLIKTIKGIPPKTESLIEAVNKITKAKKPAKPSEEEEEFVKYIDLIEATGMSQGTVMNWIKPAIEAGFIEKTKQGKYACFKPASGDKKESMSTFLPTPKEILKAFPELSEDIFYIDPVTGEGIDGTLIIMTRSRIHLI